MRLEKDQSPTQQAAVILGFLRSMRGMRKIDAIHARNLMGSMWGIYEDWHPFVDGLEHLVRMGEARIVEPGGYTVYEIFATQIYKEV